MRIRSHTYTGYSIGCAITWLLLLAVVAIKRPQKFHTVKVVCGGWWLGWLSSTIARSVYPGPKR